MSKFFYCYSIQLKDFLKLNKINYLSRHKHINGNYYWVFPKSEELDVVLSDWERYKKDFIGGVEHGKDNFNEG